MIAAGEISLLDQIGALLLYPEKDFGDRLDRCCEALPMEDTEAASLLRNFAEGIHSLPLEKVQELYTHTFDLNPVCALEVGWQLFGEEYARGEFLVAMRQRLRSHGIRESRELPDHLSSVLSLLDRMEPEEAQSFREEVVLPALNKMLAGFPEQTNPYRNLLLAIPKLLSPEPGEGFAEAPHV